MKNIIMLVLAAVSLCAADASLIGNWGCDDGSGAVVKDASGNGLTATNRGSWTAGKKGQAVLLNGEKTNYIEMYIPADKQPGTGSFTFAVWMNPTMIDIASKQKQRRIIGMDSWPVSYAVIDLLGDGTVQLGTGYKLDETRKGSANINSKTKAAVGEWMHVAGVIDRETKKITLYINGKADVEAPIAAAYELSVAIGGKPMTLGSTWQSFAGALDEVYYYKRALSASEIAALAQ